MALTIVVVAQGEMGAAVGQRLHARGAAVRTSLKGRSEASRIRAREAGMIPVDDDFALVTGADFVLSIVPISIAYHLAHYLQSLIVDFPTAVLALSDPFGLGWSLLPDEGLQHGTTMGLGPDGIIMAYRAQTALIVVGHVFATLTSHRIALRETADRRQAVLMGIPLAVLMVFYTVFGLWLLSTPEIG